MYYVLEFARRTPRPARRAPDTDATGRHQRTLHQAGLPVDFGRESPQSGHKKMKEKLHFVRVESCEDFWIRVASHARSRCDGATEAEGSLNCGAGC